MNKKQQFFKPEDFADWKIYIHPGNIAGRANALLEAHLKTLPRLWKNSYTKRWHLEPAQGFDHPDTHTALLWNVSPIGEQETKDKCKKCGRTHHPMDLVCDRCGEKIDE